MLPKKKRKLFVLYSIPIKLKEKLLRFSLCREKLYVVSYSIPLGCMVVLLLGSMIMVNPSSSVLTSALEPDAGVSTQSDGSSVVSLTVGGDALDKTVEVGINEVAYRKHSVSVRVADMMDYYLVLAGDPNLTLQSSTSTNTVPTVANDVVGANMPENRWGFAWEKDGSTSESELTYRPVSNSSITLESDSALSAGSVVDFDGQLNFAAKFGESTVLGKYSSRVSLSLIATPKTVTTAAQWKNLNGDAIGAGVESGTMQGAGPDFCNNEAVQTGFTIDLKDARDDNTYTIVKLPDGHCWMQQNLRLTATSEDGLGLTPNDTNISESWTLPKTLVGSGTTVSGWINNNDVPYSATFNNNEYGVYYNWSAATASTGSSLTSGDANGSICPKGWTLPSYSEYSNMLNKGGISNSSSGSRLISGSYYKFPYTGYVDYGNLSSSVSGYWSRTAHTTSGIYQLFLTSDKTYMTDGSRYYGYTMRCMYELYGTWQKNTISDSVLDTGLFNMQEITRNNFTNKYCGTAQNSFVPVGSTIKLVDSRDSKAYNIVKLKDGNCWMQDNLALSGPITLTSTDSDVSSNFDLPADTNGDSWGSSGDSINVVTGSASLTNWQLGYGNYYSWQAATAGTGSSATGDLDNASSSICPRGWKLPTGGATGQLYIALNGLNFASIQQAPYKFSAAGGCYGGSLVRAGTHGSYWSRTHGDFLNFFDSGFYPGTVTTAWNSGFSVRCLAEPAS